MVITTSGNFYSIFYFRDIHISQNTVHLTPPRDTIFFSKTTHFF